MMMKILLATCCLLWAGSASAGMALPQWYTCPIGGERFLQETQLSASYFRQDLDTRRHGRGPSPWPLPKCPGNGFVLFEPKFSAADLEQLAPLVASAEYQALAQKAVDRHLAAYLMEKIGRPARAVAYAYLEASWQAETPAEERQHLQAAHARFVASLEKPYGDEPQWIADQFLAGEIERRLELFDPARRRFEALLASGRLASAGLRQVAEFQIELIGQRVSTRREMPAPR